MTEKFYKVNGKVDFNKFTNYLGMSQAIKKIIPDKNFQINETINGIYKKGKRREIDLSIGIVVPSYRGEHQEEFEKIKSKLEDLLGTKLTEIQRNI